MAGNEVFSGTVDYYVRFRPDFPAAAYDAIATAFDLDGNGRLLDLGTGTGHIALALANRFESVIGIDVSEQMLAAARRESSARGVTNLEWQLARAEDIELDDGSVRLVTIGNALHWMDRDAVLARCHQFISPGGGIALIDMPGMWSPDMQLGAERWLGALRTVVERHLGAQRRAGGGYYQAQHERPAKSLARSAFVDIEVGEAQVELTWSAEEVVGYLYSTSFANREILGERVESFEADLRAELAAVEPSGQFKRRLQATWTLGRRA